MTHRIRPGLARTLVQAAALLLMCLAHTPAPNAVRRPPGYRILVAGAEIPALPRYLLRRRRVDTATARPPSRIRPHLVAHEQRMHRSLGVAA